MPNPTSVRPKPPSVLFTHGFRPFFLLAGLYATVAIASWLIIFLGWWSLPPNWPPMWWHGHEMIFGFAVAAISGFLLTAVPQWTNTERLQGAPLCLLTLTWGVGRLAIWSAAVLPHWLVAALDLIHLPLLTGFIAVPIIRAGKLRNMGFPILLALLATGNFLTHLQILRPAAQTARTGLYLGVYTVIVILTVISGRVVPAFTRNALNVQGKSAQVRSHAIATTLAILAVLATFALDLLCVYLPYPPRILRLATGTAATLAALLLALRAVHWQFHRTLGQPILWILHIGHFWLILGFLCEAASEFWAMPPSSNAFHVFSAGAIGTMALALMTRASLGHSDRALRASPTTVLAYILVISGAAIRIFGPLAGARFYSEFILAGGVLWASGYAIFTIEFWPILTRPRVDGIPG